jgi:hypothetical protein
MTMTYEIDVRNLFAGIVQCVHNRLFNKVVSSYSIFFPGRRVRAHLRKVESHS